MKTLSAFILSICISNLIFGQGSNLTVFSDDGERFYLILNGIRQNEKPETNIRVQALTNPYYSARIIFEKTGIAEIEKKMLQVQDQFNPGPMEVTYKIKKNKDATFSLKFFSSVPLAQAPPLPPNVTVVQYNTEPMPAISTNISVTETTTTTISGAPAGNNVNVGMNVGGINVGINVNDNMTGMGNTQVTQTTTTTTTTSGVRNTPPPAVVPAPPVNAVICPMPSSNYQSMVNSIKSKSFESDMLTIAKQATKVNCPTTNQILGVMKLFSFEESKLDYAKFAYQFCFNKNDYYQVNDGFTFSGSIDELNSFIGH